MASGGRAGARIISVMGLVLLPAKAFAGAWTFDAGTGQVGLTMLAGTAYMAFTDNRELTSMPRYNKFELGGLFEYGATDWLTLMLLPGLQHIDVGPPFDAQRTGLNYTEFGGRARLYNSNEWVFSVQTTIRVPGTSDASNPAAIGYTDPQVDVRALAGHNFYFGQWPAFIDLEVAQRFRSEGAPDEFRADFTLGVRPLPRWTILAQSFNVVSEGAGTWGFPSYDYYKFQLSAMYALTPAASVQFGGYTTYTGRNAIQENGVITGLWFKF